MHLLWLPNDLKEESERVKQWIPYSTSWKTFLHGRNLPSTDLAYLDFFTDQDSLNFDCFTTVWARYWTVFGARVRVFGRWRKRGKRRVAPYCELIYLSSEEWPQMDTNWIAPLLCCLATDSQTDSSSSQLTEQQIVFCCPSLNYLSIHFKLSSPAIWLHLAAL